MAPRIVPVARPTQTDADLVLTGREQGQAIGDAGFGAVTGGGERP